MTLRVPIVELLFGYGSFDHAAIDQIIQMVTAKVADDIVIKTIQNSTSMFELSSENLIKLKTAGVSDTVIRAMIR